MEVSNLFKELPFATHAIEEEEIFSNVLSAVKDITMSKSAKAIIKNLNETNAKYLETIDELKDKFRLKVKELRITEAIVISKDLQIQSLRTKIAEIENTKELPLSTNGIEEEIMSNVLSAASTVQINQGAAAGDTNVTNKEVIKIHTKPKRRGWIGKTWRRVKRAATFLCCVRQ